MAIITTNKTAKPQPIIIAANVNPKHLKVLLEKPKNYLPIVHKIKILNTKHT